MKNHCRFFDSSAATDSLIMTSSRSDTSFGLRTIDTEMKKPTRATDGLLPKTLHGTYAALSGVGNHGNVFSAVTLSGVGNHGNVFAACALSGVGNHGNAFAACALSGVGNHGNVFAACALSGVGNHGNVFAACALSGVGNHGNVFAACALSGVGNHGNVFAACALSGVGNHGNVLAAEIMRSSAIKAIFRRSDVLVRMTYTFLVCKVELNANLE